MHDHLTVAQATLVYAVLPSLAFIAGFLWSQARRKHRDNQRVPRMYGRNR